MERTPTRTAVAARGTRVRCRGKSVDDALLERPRRDALRRSPDRGGVAGDQLHPGQASGGEIAQKRQPVGAVLAGELHPEDLPVALPVDAGGQQGMHVHRPATLADHSRAGCESDTASHYHFDVTNGVTSGRIGWHRPGRCRSPTPHLTCENSTRRHGMADEADESACKPGSVSRMRGSAAIHLGLPLPTTSSGLPGSCGTGRPDS